MERKISSSFLGYKPFKLSKLFYQVSHTQKRLLLFLIFILYSIIGFTQKEYLSAQIPHPALRSFTLQKIDNSPLRLSDLEQDKKTLAIIFSPNCSHCRHQMERILLHMDDLRDINILMVSHRPIDEIATFYESYDLNKYPNINVRRDANLFLASLYGVSRIPFLAFSLLKFNINAQVDPIGPCCWDGFPGRCLEITEPQCCFQTGGRGIWKGPVPDFRCNTPGICDGACCIGGICVISPSPENCQARPGVWKGSGTLCTPTLCTAAPVSLQQCMIVPISLVYFKAIETNNAIQLLWETVAETNNEYFVIEHSVNAIHFRAVGFVRGKGTTTEKHEYFFTHNNPIAGTNYYRIKQVDFDGKFSYTQILRVIVHKNELVVTLAPNIISTSNYLQIKFLSRDNTASIQLEVFDAVGREVYNQAGLKTGLVTVSTIGWRKGLYSIRISQNKESVIQKLIIK